jgi:hypothetical protein
VGARSAAPVALCGQRGALVRQSRGCVDRAFVGERRIDVRERRIVVASAPRDLRESAARLGIGGIDRDRRLKRRFGAGQDPHPEEHLAQRHPMLGIGGLELDRLANRGDGLVREAELPVSGGEPIESGPEVGAHRNGLHEQLDRVVEFARAQIEVPEMCVRRGETLVARERAPVKGDRLVVVGLSLGDAGEPVERGGVLGPELPGLEVVGLRLVGVPLRQPCVADCDVGLQVFGSRSSAILYASTASA